MRLCKDPSNNEHYCKPIMKESISMLRSSISIKDKTIS